MKAPRAILVTRLRFLGDIVLSTPLLDALRAHFPGCSIEYLGCPPHVEVIEHHPSVDRIHRLPARASLAAMLDLARSLRVRRFDAAIDLFANPRSALLVAATGAGIRVGSDRGVRSRLYTHRRGRPEGDRSALRHHLDKIVPLVGHEVPASRPRVFVSDDEVRSIRARLGLGEADRVMVVHPGSTWPDKAWPASRWREVLRWWEERSDVPAWVVEPPGEPGLAAHVVTGSRARALPTLGVREIMALLTHTVLYVGNDGGILHLAVALGVPSLGLFGPTEPDIWFPYAPFGPFRVVHHCDPAVPGGTGEGASRLRSLQVETVIEGIEEVLAATLGRADA